MRWCDELKKMVSTSDSKPITQINCAHVEHGVFYMVVSWLPGLVESSYLKYLDLKKTTTTKILKHELSQFPQTYKALNLIRLIKNLKLDLT